MKPRSRSPWIPVAILALLVPVFIGLGAWQLDRADQKQQLQAEYDRRTSAEPLRLGSQPRHAEELRFHRLVVRGTYEVDRQVLVEIWDANPLLRQYLGSIDNPEFLLYRIRPTRVRYMREWALEYHEVPVG